MQETAPGPLDERIGRLERLVGELRGQVERLEGVIASIRPATSTTSQTEAFAATEGLEASSPIARTATDGIPALPPPLTQVHCPHCRGGNPPTSPNCMWCGRSMQVAAGETPRIATPPGMPGQGTAAQPGPTMAHAASSAIPAPPAPPATPPPSNAASTSAPSRPQADILKSGEFWLSRVGIVLFLLGIGFLFKYSVDQGWLTEWVRVAIGFVVGAALLVIGSRLGAHRQALKYILLGGSIATFYVTGYAAYQLFHLVPYELAFSFMVAVTVLAFALALGHNQPLLSIVGVAGGLATPFVLGDRSGGVVGLVTYTCLVAAGGVAVYFFRGWRALLWTTFAGTWLALLVGFAGSREFGPGGTEADWALQAGAIFCLLVFWALPVVRETLRARNPERWPVPPLDSSHDNDTRNLLESHVHALVVLAPLTTLGFSWLLWQAYLPGEILGAITLAGAAAFGGVAWSLRQSQERLAYTHAAVGVLLLTLALVQLVHGNVLMVALAVEATALHFVSRRLSDRGTSVMGHILWACVALWVGASFAFDIIVALFGGRGTEEVPVFNAQALSYLAVIGLLVATSLVIRTRGVAMLYQVTAHLSFLALLWRELHALPNGNAFVTIAWGALACALLLAGIRLDRNAPLLYMGAGTLVLLVGKLFLVDLVGLEAIWRVLIFLGIGGLFLALSYYFQNVLKRTALPGEEAEGRQP
ncbi:MAG: DUF2339 domain-containing protein [Chloroflexota bacterium]|nr:DUF2339 domain-containing protein [Chloroflexota bacterium]